MPAYSSVSTYTWCTLCILYKKTKMKSMQSNIDLKHARFEIKCNHWVAVGTFQHAVEWLLQTAATAIVNYGDSHNTDSIPTILSPKLFCTTQHYWWDMLLTWAFDMALIRIFVMKFEYKITSKRSSMISRFLDSKSREITLPYS